MVTQAKIRALLPSEARDDGTATLTFELDDIPGAVWQLELQSSLPAGVRVSLFERGGQKCALVTASNADAEAIRAAFERALEAANQVSQEAYLVAARDRKARQQAGAEER